MFKISKPVQWWLKLKMYINYGTVNTTVKMCHLLQCFPNFWVSVWALVCLVVTPNFILCWTGNLYVKLTRNFKFLFEYNVFNSLAQQHRLCQTSKINIWKKTMNIYNLQLQFYLEWIMFFFKFFKYYKLNNFCKITFHYDVKSYWRFKV